MKRQFVVVTLVILLVLDVSFRILGRQAPEYHTTALEIANIVMAALTLAVFALMNKQIDNRPNAFVRGVYSGSLLRLMVCMVGILAYVVINKSKIHKPSVFIMFGIYAVYSATETVMLSRTAKRNN
ncbi:MAG: hypothetical protein KF744_14110 [Taibaiella sp.]|nr:hypothetical protein [Taibaiella sp.]